MKLNVIQSDAESRLWYADGLQFTCSQCGNCCTGGPGYIWISTEEIVRLAEHLELSPEQTVEKYCRKIDGQFSLKERRNNGSYDCIFLKQEKMTRPAGGGEDGQIVYTKRTCSVYPVRPLQCRTWPFWKENLADPQIWNHAARRCHGMNQGRKFSLDQITKIRDAADWPQNPPTSESNFSPQGRGEERMNHG